MIDRNDDLPMSRQAKVLGISRGSVHYLPRPVSADDLPLMRRINELHLDYPFATERFDSSMHRFPPCCLFLSSSTP
jgi:putative transposase